MKIVEKFFTNIAELIKVKSIITLTIMAAITYGFVVGKVPVELYATYASSIITYYFMKKDADGEAK